MYIIIKNNEAENVDINKNGYDDMAISLKSLTATAAVFEFRLLSDAGGMINQEFCAEDWQCSEWTDCSIEGIQVRACTDSNSCGTSVSKPSEIQSCIKPTCSDGIQNQEELGIDCGGPCARRCGVGELSGKIVEVPSPEKSEKSKYGFLLMALLAGLIGMLTMITRVEHRVKAHIHKSQLLTNLHEHHHETAVSPDAAHKREIETARLKLLLMNIAHVIIIIVIIAIIYYFVR